MNIIHHTYLKLEVPEEHYLSKMERYEISVRLKLPLKGTDLGLQKLYKIEHLTFTYATVEFNIKQSLLSSKTVALTRYGGSRY